MLMLPSPKFQRTELDDPEVDRSSISTVALGNICVIGVTLKLTTGVSKTAISVVALLLHPNSDVTVNSTVNVSSSPVLEVELAAFESVDSRV